MLSIVLRTAQALSLHLPDPPFIVSPFEKEMRRRLWLGIGLLDTLTSLARGTEPMMKLDWLESHPLLMLTTMTYAPLWRSQSRKETTSNLQI
jgi:hypothetical protein